jgi:hypothetical protein
MGYIKEPDGVDFVIKGKPLTEKQKKAISEFIKADKERLAKLASRKTKVRIANHRLSRTTGETER